VLDETVDDILFLCGPHLGGKREARHNQFIELFFQENLTYPETLCDPTKGAAWSLGR